ncbi:RING-H2 finger protein ATL78 [Linum perenne]
MDSTTNHVLLQITTARRLLLDSSPSPVAAVEPDNKFDANVVMVLSVLLCALICSLGLNSIVRCALRISQLVPAAGDQLSSGSNTTATTRRANTGIKKKALKTFPVVIFSDGMNLDAECVICLSEFAAGDRVKILPRCNHGFHVKCIDKWLGSHSSCPTCRHCLLDTCRKIVGVPVPVAAVVAVVSSPPLPTVSDDSSSTTATTSTVAPAKIVRSNNGGDAPSATVAVAEDVVISMPPMEAEGPVREHRIINSVLFWRKN